MTAFLTRLKGVLALLATLAIALAPTWFYLTVRMFAEPDGFWQELALGVAAVWVLGSIQLVCVFVWIFAAFFIWSLVEDSVPRRR